MSLIDDNDPIRALGFITVYSAYAEQCIDDLLDLLGEDSLKRAQATKKIRRLKEMADLFEWANDEGERFQSLLSEAEAIFDKRGEYIHNRYIGCSNGEIIMKPGRPDRLEEKVTSGTLYEFANFVFDMSSAFNASKFWLSRAKKKIEQV
jgi:hypothetical protein